IRSAKLHSFPSPVRVKHHPHVVPLPVGAQVSKPLSWRNAWFVFCLKCENRRVCCLIMRLHGRENVSAQSEHEPKPLWANAIHNIVETTGRDSVEATLKFE